LKIWEIADGRGLKDVERYRLGRAGGEERRAQGRPAAVNRPEQCRDALRVT